MSVYVSKHYRATFANRGVNYHSHASLYSQELFHFLSVHPILPIRLRPTYCDTVLVTE